MPSGAGFSVTITAHDQVTKTIDKINMRLKEFSAPYEKLQKSIGQFADVSGLARVGRAFGDIGRAGRDAASSIARIVEPLGIITGVASIAGVIRMTQAWADWGSTLQFNARRAGLAANTLYTLQNAGRLAGVSAAAVSTGMQHLRDTMADAAGGRNAMALGYFRSLGISLQQLKGPAENILPAISDGIAKLQNSGANGPSLAARLNASLMGNDDLIRLFGSGAAGLDDYIKQARALGGITDDQVKKANQLRQSQAALNIATESFGITLSAALEPVLKPVIDYMTDWLTVNKQWLSDSITDEVKEFVKWIKSGGFDRIKGDFRDAYLEIKGVVDELGGLKNAIEIVLAVMTAGFALKVLAPFFALAGALDGMLLKIPRVAAAMRGLSLAGAAATTAAGAEGAAGTVAAVAAGGVAATAGAAIAAVIAGGAAVALVGYLLPHVTDWLSGHGWDGSQNSAHGNSMAGRGHAAGSGTNATGRFNTARAQEDITDFMRMGWSRTQANILEGNLRQESGLNDTARNPASGAYGLAQWLGPRAADFARVEGVSLDRATRAQQRNFINWELNNTESSSGSLLRSLTNEGQAAQFGRSYERYGANEEGARTSYAQQLAAMGLTGAADGLSPIHGAHLGTSSAYASLGDLPSASIGIMPAAMAPPMRLTGTIPGMGSVSQAGSDNLVHVVVEAGAGTKASVQGTQGNVTAKAVQGVAQSSMATSVAS